MAAATELHGEARNSNHTDNLAIFFAEESHSTLLLSFLNGQLFNLYSLASKNFFIHKSFYLSQLLLGNLGEMGEVKAQSIGTNIATCLVNMAAQHLLQSSVQQMGCSVVAGNIQLAGLVHCKGHSVAYIDHALGNLANHDDSTVRQLLGSGNIDDAGGAGNGAQIAQLAAALSMEGSHIADDSNLGAVISSFHRLCIMSRIQLHNSCRGSSFINLQGSNLNASGVVNNRTAFLVVASITSHLTLYFQSSIKASLIHGHALLFQNLGSQFPREAKGIVQLEGSSAIQLRLACFLQLGNFFIQEFAALLQGAQEAGLLHINNLLDIIAFFS